MDAMGETHAVGGPPGTASDIDTLEARGLIRVAAYRPELEYLFRHWLVQDAAYGSLLKQERRSLHRLVGEALEGLYPERRAELAGVLAMHFEQAGDTDRAIDYLVADGRYALERAAVQEAFAAFDRAFGLLPDPGPDEPDAVRRRRIELGVLRMRAGWTFRPSEAVVAELEVLLPDAEALGDLELLADVHLHLALVRIEAGTPASDPLVARSLRRLDEISAALDDPSLAALPLALVAMNKVFVGPVREGVDALRDAIPLMEKRRDFIGAAFARGWLAIGYGTLGEFAEAEAAARKAAEMAASGDLIAQLDAQIADAMVRSLRGDLNDAAPIARACVERSEETGATACAVVSAWILGDVLYRQGRYGPAREAHQLGLDLAPGNDPGMFGPTLRAWLRANPTTPGEFDASGWQDLIDEARRRGNHLGESAILWKRAEAATRARHWDHALADFEAAATIAETQGARPNLARLLRGWAGALRAVGREDDARQKLRRALDLFTEMGIAQEADQVRQELGSPP